MKLYPTEKLGNLCHVAAGGTPSRAKSEYFDGDIPWVKIGDLLQGAVISTDESISRQGLENSSAKVFPVGTVLISIFATIGRTAVLGVNAATNQAIAGVTPRNPALLDAKYLRHYFDSNVKYLISIARGVAQLNINLGILKDLDIPVPPISEQRRIAAILDQADALRAKRREALAQLDSLTQSIFIEMFGDPVVNPMSWNCRSLDEVTNKVTDGEHLNPTFAESGMPIVMAGNVLVDQIDLDVAKKVETALGQQFRKKCGPEFGDLLIVGRGATIGRLCRVNVHDFFCLMGSVILVKPDRSILDERYLSGMLAMPSMHAMLYKTSGSSAQQAIYLKDVKRLACPMPPLSLQQTFATRIQAVEALKAIQRTALTELDTLFASLQHRAFQGEL